MHSQYERSIAIDPSDPDVHNNLGFLFMNCGDLDQAGEHFRRAIALKPDFAHPHFNLGRILQGQGWMADASHEFELAIQLDPSYREFLTNAGPEQGTEAQKSRATAGP
ncbi:MAG: tetratricopeptide repeat protein [Planctomycetes bacterium]|nr:tetratricopeptide repeat protein [Planctomycetota bacterium]